MNKKVDANDSLDIMAMVSKISPSLLSFSQSSKKDKETAVDGDVLKAIKDACDIAEISITTVTGKVTCTQAGGKDDFLNMVDSGGRKVKASGLTALQKTDIEMTNQNKFKKCNKTDDRKCPGADIVGKEWKLTSGSNEVGEASESPYKEKSCMVCLQGGAIYFLDSGQNPGDFFVLIEESMEKIENYSDELVEFVKLHEGLALTSYNNGKTIGYGFDFYLYPKIKINYNADGSITESEAERLLRIILDQSKDQLNVFLNENNLQMSQNAYDVAIGIFYNRNCNELTKDIVTAMAEEDDSKVLELLDDFDYRYALEYIYKGDSIAAQAYVDRNPGLLSRREEEYSIYKNGFE